MTINIQSMLSKEDMTLQRVHSCGIHFVCIFSDSKCYGFFKTQKTWSQAKATCEAYGKTYSLVTIQSQLEQSKS